MSATYLLKTMLSSSICREVQVALYHLPVTLINMTGQRFAKKPDIDSFPDEEQLPQPGETNIEEIMAEEEYATHTEILHECIMYTIMEYLEQKNEFIRASLMEICDTTVVTQERKRELRRQIRNQLGMQLQQRLTEQLRLHNIM